MLPLASDPEPPRRDERLPGRTSGSGEVPIMIASQRDNEKLALSSGHPGIVGRVLDQTVQDVVLQILRDIEADP
jgi:hypothetical protein